MIPRFSMQVLLMALALLASFAAPAAQRTFATPQAAAQALHDTVRSGDTAALAAVLGPGSADVIASGDPAEDMGGRARFIAAFEQSAMVEPAGRGRVRLVIGPEAWHFPFPLVHGRGGWRFDTRAGRDEVIARRIGRNELAAMQAVLAYVDAQRDYALERHDGAGPGVYARRIASEAGRHDGLYWTPTRDDPLSPLGVMFTLAAADETARGEAQPYHGYFFRVLESQGPHAPDGAMDYVVGGRMIGGFGIVAYPARYRVTGVRTFLASHEGVVHSRDLGVRTPAIARAMKRFDPDRTWRHEAVAVAVSGPDEGIGHRLGELGCTVCHRTAPASGADAATPLAPSFREIAARYRGQDRAEERLTRVVIEGADRKDRHWTHRHEFTEMGANAPRVSPDEARAIVRWILATP
jgi:cytochrome c551/c552